MAEIIAGNQIDHMTVTKNGLSFKHFQAWERKSKTIIAQIYSRARSLDAKKFLLHLLETAPYKIQSIQVDGGSEFMLEFENACAELNIPLFVNPPATPKYNGGVERGNRIFREEFYANPNLLAVLRFTKNVDLGKVSLSTLVAISMVLNCKVEDLFLKK